LKKASEECSRLINDIDEYLTYMIDSIDDLQRHNVEVIDRTIEYYEELYDDAYDEGDRDGMQKYEEIIDIIKMYYNRFGMYDEFYDEYVATGKIELKGELRHYFDSIEYIESNAPSVDLDIDGEYSHYFEYVEKYYGKKESYIGEFNELFYYHVRENNYDTNAESVLEYLELPIL